MAPKKVLIADDSEFMRVAYKRILETQEDYEVVALAVNGKDALDKAIRFSPDVALMDIRMPEMDGIEATGESVEILPDIAVIIISAYDDPKFLANLLRSGPQRKGYILKNSLDDIEELLRTVDAVALGQTVLDPGMVLKLSRLYSQDARWLNYRLTTIEQDVLEFAAEGYDDQAIAANSRLTTVTVQDLFEEIYRKLGSGAGSGIEEPMDRRIQAIQVFVNQITLTLAES